ncbi:MAG: choice-of-anchor B family protein [Psychrobium sp.]
MTSFTKFMTCSISVFLMICASFDSDAHAEKDKARYVAPNGVDQGLCDNPLRPCKTMLYGISKAAKGDKLLMAAGDYNLESLEEILALKGALVPVYGGYNRFDHYGNQSPATNITRLYGVPSDMADLTRQKGFTVMNDGKSKFSKQLIASANQQYTAASQSQSATSCVNGKAGAFSCNNIDLVAHVALEDFSFKPGAGNDIWGHVDLNTDKEYAIMGILNGIAVFDLSNPESPREVGSISGKNSSWRDIKVYQYFDKNIGAWQAYAYATVDGTNDFVSIIDLNQLPNSISLVTKDTAVAMAHNVYISNLDYTTNTALKDATPTLQLVGAQGSKISSKSFLSYSLEDPKQLSPLPVGANGSNGYTHDGTSLRIDDDRKTTDCVDSSKTCEVFVDFNENEIMIWDATTPGQEKKLSQTTYNDVSPSAQYVHSGWWSEDKKYIFVHDEFDESRGGLNTTLRIYDISSLTNPRLAGVWKGETQAIDHNGFVRGNRYYMSNYRRGLTILDITDPTTPQEVGYFDTFVANDSDGFDGAWGVYPFLPSGLILVSDIKGGLFVLRDNTRKVSQGTLSFETDSINTEANNSIDIAIKRMDGDTGEITVGWEILPGSALAGEDYTDQSGTLTWQASNTDTKTVNIEVANNDVNEAKEQFFVRLFNPTNGATLSTPHYTTVTIEGKKIAGAIGFEHSQLALNEQSGTTKVQVYRVGGSDGTVSVSFELSANSATIDEDVVNATGTLEWQDGDTQPKLIDLTLINDELLEQDESLTLTLSANNDTVLASNSALVVTIKDDDNNAAPVLTISENFEVNTRQTANLTSNATDPENDDITYQWQQTSGPSVSMINSTMKDASFVAPSQAATLVFTVTATDSRGAQTEKSVSVTIKQTVAPEPPTDSSSSGGSIHYWLIILFGLLTLRYKMNLR